MIIKKDKKEKEKEKVVFKKKRLHPNTDLHFNLKNFPYFIKYYLREIKFLWQRAIYGYSDFDVWDIDHWFLDVVPNMLRQLAATSHSYPDEFKEYENWEKFLNNLADTFEKSKEPDILHYSLENYKKWGEEATKAKNEGFEQFSKWFYHFWD